QENAEWIARFVVFQASPLCVLGVFFHSIIGLNRLTAMLFTMHHRTIWTARTIKTLHFIGWIFAFICSLPLIWPVRGNFQYVNSPFGERGISFIILTGRENILYQGMAVIFGSLLELIILITYFVIALNARKYKACTAIVFRTTIASMLMC
ncbi:hypothetical protein PFISCL1PPCAC_5833, partial [Pristionchus fissidentatus]